MSDTASTPETQPTIPFETFTQLDLRVATITAAEAHPDADRLLKIQLDDGTADGRQVCAGIKAWYDPQSLVGTQVVIVANLEPRVIRGEKSEGMILACTSGETVSVLRVDNPSEPGSKVS
ncbi:MAG: methionine--tRNA ligase subunit beta [Planctomycetota bacterium]|nr:methionine--tRNA ligase subunit beta [Planctomycetota bacterium]